MGEHQVHPEPLHPQVPRGLGRIEHEGPVAVLQRAGAAFLVEKALVRPAAGHVHAVGLPDHRVVEHAAAEQRTHVRHGPDHRPPPPARHERVAVARVDIRARGRAERELRRLETRELAPAARINAVLKPPRRVVLVVALAVGRQPELAGQRFAERQAAGFVRKVKRRDRHECVFQDRRGMIGAERALWLKQERRVGRHGQRAVQRRPAAERVIEIRPAVRTGKLLRRRVEEQRRLDPQPLLEEQRQPFQRGVAGELRRQREEPQVERSVGRAVVFRKCRLAVPRVPAVAHRPGKAPQPPRPAAHRHRVAAALAGEDQRHPRRQRVVDVAVMPFRQRRLGQGLPHLRLEVRGGHGRNAVRDRQQDREHRRGRMRAIGALRRAEQGVAERALLRLR